MSWFSIALAGGLNVYQQQQALFNAPVTQYNPNTIIQPPRDISSSTSRYIILGFLALILLIVVISTRKKN